MSEENKDRYKAQGYHPVFIGDVFQNRYRVVSKLGYGTFSTVWLARDLLSYRPRHVALKVVVVEHEIGNHELELSMYMRHVDRRHEGYSHVLHLHDSFRHKGPNGSHICLVYMLMGQNLSNLRASFPEKRIPVALCRQIAEQLLKALDCLHNACGVVHCDMKADNILIELTDPINAVEQYLNSSNAAPQQSSKHSSKLQSHPVLETPINADSKIHVRLADFGIASRIGNYLSDRIQTICYRAPEALLLAPWGPSVDTWSFGCIMYSLVQGKHLFSYRLDPKISEEEDQLVQMAGMLGPMPEALKTAGADTKNYFDAWGGFRNGAISWDAESLDELLTRRLNPSMSEREYENFAGFVKGMLVYDPQKRKTPKELLQTEWLTELRFYLESFLQL